LGTLTHLRGFGAKRYALGNGCPNCLIKAKPRFTQLSGFEPLKTERKQKKLFKSGGL
jgi:hypothetical protein